MLDHAVADIGEAAAKRPACRRAMRGASLRARRSAPRSQWPRRGVQVERDQLAARIAARLKRIRVDREHRDVVRVAAQRDLELRDRRAGHSARP